MSRLTDEQRGILQDLAQRMAATEGRHGMVTAVALQYVIMDEDGDEYIGGWYDGGYVQALGLVTDAAGRLIEDEER